MGRETDFLNGTSHLKFSPLDDNEIRQSLYYRHRFPTLHG